MSAYAISCGGTGGHLSPGIAVAEELTRRNKKCLLLVSEKLIDGVMLKKYSNFDSIVLSAKPFSKNFKKFWQFLKAQMISFFECIKLIREKKITCVIGMGGFTNVPIVLAAFVLRKKIALHESNRIVGKSIKILSYFADVIFLPEEIEFGNGFLRRKTIQATFPLRHEIHKINKSKARNILSLSEDGFVLTVLGGSQGAEALNQWAVANMEQLNAHGIALCCVRGIKSDKNEIVEGKSGSGSTVRNAFLSFCNDMSMLLSATDLLVCRAGAGTIAEAAFFSLPMILVPYPNSADNHQQANAAYVEKKGAALVVNEDNIEVLLETVLESFMQKLKNFNIDDSVDPKKSEVEIIVDCIQQMERL
ncbi:MAG: UDP-N-acetylglucosamine--N-acetylmuramyl-(pentapeptide) pyrophosphoryl-undecaprenol N-acetylglucosamine transferase [Puniceicoccales bacterium]|jgi:UDP-N-acetylglucosamine--N-acetylmuramyl-(pentapeptide) pyrophosphoryl-undecaprenol N-acetylglucosamine transferase|nr:UDP-N-acetylglucosamine--N-acetylmuramyl-(pentapeptide) pyrophosphoryl-undecaprenol N-acetylglucosamine transferase [Puniceicoccales bacterium]